MPAPGRELGCRAWRVTLVRIQGRTNTVPCRGLSNSRIAPGPNMVEATCRQAYFVDVRCCFDTRGASEKLPRRMLRFGRRSTSAPFLSSSSETASSSRNGELSLPRRAQLPRQQTRRKLCTLAHVSTFRSDGGPIFAANSCACLRKYEASDSGPIRAIPFPIRSNCTADVHIGCAGRIGLAGRHLAGLHP
jgi:hypothetical protein